MDVLGDTLTIKQITLEELWLNWEQPTYPSDTNGSVLSHIP